MIHNCVEVVFLKYNCLTYFSLVPIKIFCFVFTFDFKKCDVWFILNTTYYISYIIYIYIFIHIYIYNRMYLSGGFDKFTNSSSVSIDF